VTARVPAFLQDSDIGIENAPLLTRSGVFGEAVAGHILSHCLPAQLELASDLDDGRVLSLQPLDLSVAGVASFAAGLLANLVQRPPTPVAVAAAQRCCGITPVRQNEKLWPEAVEQPLQSLTEIPEYMPAVGNLNRIRSSSTDPTRILFRAVAGHELDTGILLEPGGDGLGRTVGQQIDHGVGFTIGEDSAINPALLKGEVVDTDNPGRRPDGGRSGVSTAEERVAAGWHSAASTLTCSSLTAEGQCKLAERLIQAVGSLSGGGEQLRQALGEGNRRTGRKEAAKAADVEQEVNRQATHRQIAGPPRVVAVNTS
jgi:hypothetical protein